MCELQSAEQQEVLLKKDLEILQSKLKLNTSYERLKRLEKEVEEKIERNRVFEKGMKSMNKVIKQNTDELLKRGNQMSDMRLEVQEENLRKQLAKEIEKEALLMKKIKREQEVLEKKQELQSKLEVSLQPLQFELKALEETYKSKYDMDMLVRNNSLDELRNELTQLKGILVYEQEKSALTISKLVKDIEAAKYKIRIKGYVSVRAI